MYLQYIYIHVLMSGGTPLPSREPGHNWDFLGPIWKG